MLIEIIHKFYSYKFKNVLHRYIVLIQDSETGKSVGHPCTYIDDQLVPIILLYMLCKKLSSNTSLKNRFIGMFIYKLDSFIESEVMQL